VCPVFCLHQHARRPEQLCEHHEICRVECDTRARGSEAQ
jgi:hypothetical protein